MDTTVDDTTDTCSPRPRRCRPTTVTVAAAETMAGLGMKTPEIAAALEITPDSLRLALRRADRRDLLTQIAVERQRSERIRPRSADDFDDVRVRLVMDGTVVRDLTHRELRVVVWRLATEAGLSHSQIAARVARTKRTIDRYSTRLRAEGGPPPAAPAERLLASVPDLELDGDESPEVLTGRWVPDPVCPLVRKYVAA